MPEKKVIDVWMQHPTPVFLNNEIFDSLKRWTGGTFEATQYPLDATIQCMDQAQINLGMIGAWYGPQGALISNEEVKSYVDQYPNRLAGVAGVNLKKPVQAIKQLRQCVTQWGFKALRIVQWLWDLPPTHRYYYPLFATCVELNIPVCLQVGHTGPLCPSETGRPIPYIDQIALDFPELSIVCGHIGYPWTSEMIAVATKHENVFIDTSAYTIKRFPPELVHYIQHHGNKKVLFGSNYPMLTPEQCLAELASLNLNNEQQNNFLYKNAAHVFKL